MKTLKSALSLRGDHYWCPLSLQLDSYWGCGANCPMCYLRRLNRTWGTEPRAADPEEVQKELTRGLQNPDPKTPLGRAIHAKKTIRFGNKADPYQPLEQTERISGKILQVFKDLDWSYVVQTKFPSRLLALDLETIKASQGQVMIEMSPGMDWDWEHLEARRTEPPEIRMEAAREFIRNGVKVSFNGEPFVPGLHTGGQFREVLRQIKSLGCTSYNTYFMHLNDYNLKALYANGVDIEKIWEGTQDGAWKPIQKELIHIAQEEGMTLGCPDFVCSGSYIQASNTCCGMDVPNPSRFNVMEWKRLWLQGIRDIDAILARTWDGVGNLQEAKEILEGKRPEVFSLIDLEKEIQEELCAPAPERKVPGRIKLPGF